MTPSHMIQSTGNQDKAMNTASQCQCPKTFLVPRPQYSGVTRSISRLLLSWDIASPSQQLWLKRCKTKGSPRHLRGRFDISKPYQYQELIAKIYFYVNSLNKIEPIRVTLMIHKLFNYQEDINAKSNSLQKRWYMIFLTHDEVIKWKHFPRNWPSVRGIHRSPVNSPHKSQWRGALIFSLICVWINGWVNNGEAGDLRRYRAHYDVTVM